MMRSLWVRFRDRVLLREASTRAAALFRIGLALLLWTRFGTQLLLGRSLDPTRIAWSLLFYLGTTLLVFGLYTRFAAVLTAAVTTWMVYGIAIGKLAPVFPDAAGWGSHHVVLLVHGAILLMFMPSEKSYSLDRWLALRRAERTGKPPPVERGPVWGLYLMGVQLSAVYFWAAVDKSHWGFLSGERMQMILVDRIHGSDFPPLPLWAEATMLMGIGAMLIQYTLAFGLWVRPLQRWLIPAGIVLHLVFFYILPVSTFTVTMFVMYLGYLDPDAVHRAIERMSGHPATVPWDAAPHGDTDAASTGGETEPT
jgi:uncharacterized membrane protein YidH (DUF202 family)